MDTRWTALLILATVFVCIQGVEAKEIVVRLDRAGWANVRGNAIMPESQIVDTGDVVVFKHKQEPRDFHKMPSRKAFHTCDFSAAKPLGTESSRTYIWTAEDAGVHYFASRRQDDQGENSQCRDGEKFSIFVRPRKSASSTKMRFLQAVPTPGPATAPPTTAPTTPPTAPKPPSTAPVVAPSVPPPTTPPVTPPATPPVVPPSTPPTTPPVAPPTVPPVAPPTVPPVAPPTIAPPTPAPTPTSPPPPPTPAPAPGPSLASPPAPPPQTPGASPVGGPGLSASPPAGSGGMVIKTGLWSYVIATAAVLVALMH